MLPLVVASAVLVACQAAFAQSTASSAPEGFASNYIIASNSNVRSVNLTVTTQDHSKQNETAPKLYGLMFEDIDHSGDGGIYAEMLINRAFQGSPIDANDNPTEPYGPSLTGWYPIGNASIALDRLHPLSDALPNSLALTVGANATGEVGLLNTGWWGMDVSPQTYNASFYVVALNNTYAANQTTTFTVSLRSNLTGETWASSTIDSVHIDTFRYMQLNSSIYNNATAPNGNNTFALTFDAEALRGQTLHFSLLSLFPETFKNRPNGLRKDLADAMYAMKPKFLRCPGGNNIEGESIQQRLKWWETIGPLKDRPGRIGDWGYYNTDGLGLMEYMAWCEDMEMEPVLAVYAGYSLDGTSYPEQYMDEVLQEILDELEFLLGNTTSKWGSKRAEYGHPEPYVINYVEVGNEDFFSCTYPYRWPYLYSHLKSAYPDIRFISTAFRENQAGGYNSRCNWTVELPSGSGDDTPSFYLNNFDIFDNFANNSLDDVEILLGEYSVFQLDTFSQFVNFSDPPGIHPEYPQVIHALGEGVYQLAAERNPGLVTLSAYAPSLQNRNKYVWTPNMISFEAQYNQTVLTTSYWQQWLFSQYRGSHTVPVSGEINPLYWVGTIDNSTGVMYLKVINTGNQTIALDIQFDTSYTSVNATTLQNDDPNAYNWITNQTAVVPRALNGTALPQMGAGNDSSSPFYNATSSDGVPSPMDTPSAMNASSSMNTTAASNSTMAFVTRDDGGASGGSVWSWTVPVFSSTVLQFNP